MLGFCVVLGIGAPKLNCWPYDSSILSVDSKYFKEYVIIVSN